MAWYNSAKDLGNSLKGAGKSLLGGREDSGILGTGQFRSNEHKVDDKAFQSTAGDANRGEFLEALKGVQGRSAPQMNTAQADQWRGRQEGFAGALQARMRGEGSSVAEMQMQRGLNQSLANSNSQAASMRGVSPAMAMRLSQQNQANMSQEAVGQGAMLRAQEQQAAEGQYGNLINSARGMDLETSQANMNAGMQQRQLNDQQDRFLREGVTTMDERNRQANIDRERMKSQNSLGYNQINSGAYQSAAQNRAGTVGGVAGGIAGIIASDKNLKTDVQPLKFDSPANSTFKASMPAAMAAEEDHFEPTIEAADAKKKEDTRSAINQIGQQKTETQHQKMGQGFAQLGAAIFSDEKAKKGAVDGGKSGKGFLDALQAYTYKYKDPAHGEGEQLGVMAQDLEKHPVGKSLVIDTPEGKMVDYGKAGGVMMANQAMLNERLSQLEGLFKSRASKRSA